MKKIICLMAALTFTSSVMAAETDQFYASDAVLKDSSDVLNDFFHERIQMGIDKSNHQKNLPECRAVASEVLTQVLGEFSVKGYIKERTFSKISHFTQKSPLVDRFPEDSLKESEYRETSIYRNRPFPINVVGVARTLNVNGIFIGTDKLGHFSIVGRTYYKNFLKGIEEGLSEKDAEIAAIKKGFKQEVAILGYAIGGTLSYADLESNYQGLKFARNMCEGENPYLKLVNGKWTQNETNQFDIRTYTNPKVDEAFNVSFWSPRLWRKMKQDIIPAYCKNKSNANYLKREESYKALVTRNLNDELIDAFVKEKPKYDRNNQLLSKSIKCND